MAAHTQLEPPDGGWGILVCIGMALPFISGLSAMLSFGLVFGDFLKSIGAGTSALAFITSFFFCSMSFAGLFSGSLFNRFGLRTVGIWGGLLYFGGSVAQVFVNSTWTLTIAFSILQGSGFGLIIPASYTSFNNYFVKKRVVWMSFAQSLIGLGSMFYPVLMQKLLDLYGFRGCLLILAALNAHAVLGMLLMQPVEWHMRVVKIEEPVELKEVEPATITPPPAPLPSIITSRPTFVNGETENAETEDEALHHLSPLTNGSRRHSTFSQEGKKMSLTSKSIVVNSETENDEAEEEAVHHLSPLTHGSRSHSAFSREEFRMRSRRSSSIISLGNWTGPIVVTDFSPEMTIRSRAHSTAESLRDVTSMALSEEKKLTLWEKIVDFLDLTFLKDPIYINIVMGVTFALYSDVAFFTLQPLYLFELGFGKHDTANIIAIGAAADLASRIFLAFSAIFIQMPSRYIYLAGAFFTVIARFAFFNVSNFKGIACITAVMGFLRTWVHVPLPLVFAEFLPKERFATGYGLFMFLQGNILFLIGPLVGYLRDTTKNYILTFHVINLFMVLCVVPWIIEIVCVKFRRKQKFGTNL